MNGRPGLLRGLRDLDRSHYGLVGLLAITIVFEQFDLSLIGTTIKYVAEDLALPEADLSERLSLVHLGGLPSLLLAAMADRLGRRLARTLATSDALCPACCAALISSGARRWCGS